MPLCKPNSPNTKPLGARCMGHVPEGVHLTAGSMRANLSLASIRSIGPLGAQKSWGFDLAPPWTADIVLRYTTLTRDHEKRKQQPHGVAPFTDKALPARRGRDNSTKAGMIRGPTESQMGCSCFPLTSMCDGIARY